MSLYSGIAIGSGVGLGTAYLLGSGPLGLTAGTIGLLAGSQEATQFVGGTNAVNGVDTWAGAAVGGIVTAPLAGAALAGPLAPLGLLAGALIGSTWGNTTIKRWDTSAQVASNRATESQQYQVVNKTVGDVKKSLGIEQFSDVGGWLGEKGGEQNLITQTTRKKTTSWWGLARQTKYSYRNWLETNDQLLSRYGYETYAQKANNLNESLKWMEVKDINKLNEDVLLTEVKDTAGQDLERQVARNQMNNYFGQYYVDAEKA